MDDSKDEIAMSGMINIGDHVTRELRSMNHKIDRIEKMLSGNGTPEKGMIARVLRIELIVSALIFICGALVLGLVGIAVTKIWG